MLLKAVHWLETSGRGILLFLIFTISAPYSVNSYCKHLSAFAPVYQEYKQGKLPKEEYKEKAASAFFGAAAKGWYFHVSSFLAVTFLFGLLFNHSPKIVRIYLLFPLGIIPFWIAACFFFQAEIFGDLMKDSDKIQNLSEIITVKFCSLIVSIFSGGFSFEMARSCFFDSDNA